MSTTLPAGTGGGEQGLPGLMHGSRHDQHHHHHHDGCCGHDHAHHHEHHEAETQQGTEESKAQKSLEPYDDEKDEECEGDNTSPRGGGCGCC